MARLKVRPSKSASMMGLIVGGIFVGIGAFVVIPIFGAFGILWTLVAGAITLFHAVNAFSARGVATTEIDFEGGIFDPPELPFDDRMRRLKQLREDGLINEQEYQEKRREIMESDW